MEDITAERGPLLYAPGSHRMQWFEFKRLRRVAGFHRPGAAPGLASPREQQLERLGRGVEASTCERGDVFVWHAGLLHGGQPVEDETPTRKSFVVHYTSEAHYASRTARRQVKSTKDGETVWRTVSATTADRIEVGGRLGLESPLHYARD